LINLIVYRDADILCEMLRN